MAGTVRPSPVDAINALLEHDGELEAANEEAQIALAYHRWHWTKDESNPERVSIEAYARQVGKHESDIRKYVHAYELFAGRLTT